MLHERVVPLLGVLLFLSAEVFATTFGSVRGIVHDPGHRPIEGAQVTIRARGSGWSAKTESNADGEFHFDAVPVGGYEVTVDAPNFASSQQEINVTTGDNPVFHFQLELGAMKQAVEVQARRANSAPSLPHSRSRCHSSRLCRLRARTRQTASR
jgi:hypothetical protein